MRKPASFAWVFALLTLTGLTIGSYSPGARAAGAENDHQFSFRLNGEPETLDWNRAHTPIETYILMNIMEGLLTFNEKMEVAPSLARSWTISKDGLTYTFKLRDDVKWSDGVPLKARDFVYSWKRLLSPVTAASYAYFLFDIEGAEDFYKGKAKDFSAVGIKAPDDLTVQVKLARPVAHWIDIPTFWVTFPLREDVVARHGQGWDAPGRMVTLGPYAYVGHEYDSKIILKANPFYHGKRGNIEQITGMIVKDDTTALTLYEAGKLDLLTDIATLDLRRLKGNPELKTFPYLKTGYLGFVVDKFPLNNVKVRRAISMGIDRSKLGEILHGGQKPAASFVPPGLPGHSDAVGLKFDPALARAELKVAGLDPGRPVNLELLLPNWDKDLTISQFIQGELKKNLGLEVTLQPFDHRTFRAQLDLHSFPFFILSWSADYPDPDNFMSMWLSSSGNNRTNWKSTQYDDWVLKARGLRERSGREHLYLQAQKLLQEDQAVILPLYYEPNMALVRSRVKGFELNPLNYMLLRKVNLGG